jgi:hypothetical protein
MMQSRLTDSLRQRHVPSGEMGSSQLMALQLICTKSPVFMVKHFMTGNQIILSIVRYVFSSYSNGTKFNETFRELSCLITCLSSIIPSVILEAHTMHMHSNRHAFIKNMMPFFRLTTGSGPIALMRWRNSVFLPSRSCTMAA